MIKQQPSTIIKTQGKMRFCQILFMVFISTAMVFISTANAADYIWVQCSGGAGFTQLTPYETNVNSLFSSLVNSASVTIFNKFEISETNVVYGLYQCRGDLESSKCKDCVASSVNQLKTACPLSVGGSIQLDGCFLKYDNKPFFGVKNTVEELRSCGPSIGYNTDILYSRDDALENLMAGNGKYFHSGDYGSIRGVAQCVQDLSPSDCQGCLSEASGRLRSECETSSWGDMFLEKCYIQYDDRDIGHSSNNNSKDEGGGNNSKKIKKILSSILGVILAIVVAAIVTIIKVCIKNYLNGTKAAEKEKKEDQELLMRNQQRTKENGKQAAPGVNDQAATPEIKKNEVGHEKRAAPGVNGLALIDKRGAPKPVQREEKNEPPKIMNDKIIDGKKEQAAPGVNGQAVDKRKAPKPVKQEEKNEPAKNMNQKRIDEKKNQAAPGLNDQAAIDNRKARKPKQQEKT